MSELFNKQELIAEPRRDLPNNAQKRQEILAALREAPLSTYDVEHNWHRGQAVIGELRRRGYEIKTVHNKYYLISEPQQELVSTNGLSDKYYATTWWRKKARERKEFDGWRCVWCKSTDGVQTHHWMYDLFNESMEDLMTLCRHCHEKIHDLISGSSVHFPRRLTSELAERIESEAQRGSDND